MRVLHINASYKPAYVYGGPTVSVSMLCEQLVAQGISADVFTTTANGDQELQTMVNTPVNVDGVTVTYFKRITRDHTHFSPALLRKMWLNVKQYDIVHIHAWWNLVSVLAAWVAIRRGVPLIISPRGMLSSYSFATNNSRVKRLIHEGLGKYLLRRSVIHVTSKHEEAAIRQLVTPKQIFVLPNLVKLPGKKIAVTKDDDAAPLKLIFFSRIEPKKGLDILFAALKNVKIKFTLTIAGNGDEAYISLLKIMAADYGIADTITWAGFLQDDKFEVLGRHDLFALPSHDENFGNAVIESLAAGTPVLVSNNVGLHDYVTQNNLGWACKTNATDLMRTINEIGLLPITELAAIGIRAAGLICKDFAHENLIQQYFSKYNEIISNGRL